MKIKIDVSDKENFLSTLNELESAIKKVKRLAMDLGFYMPELVVIEAKTEKE